MSMPITQNVNCFCACALCNVHVDGCIFTVVSFVNSLCTCVTVDECTVSTAGDVVYKD